MSASSIEVNTVNLSAVMPRKRRTFMFDVRLLDGLKAIARKENSSVNNWLETLVMQTLREKGVIDEDFEPIQENRGGLRNPVEGVSDGD
ncbi:MAG: hypothetical protein AAFY20_15155 [Cyanobacteria bacterium J06639_14]